jgi:hypothetical protein
MEHSKISLQLKIKVHKDYPHKINLINKPLILKFTDNNNSTWFNSKWQLSNRWYLTNKKGFMIKCRKTNKQEKKFLRSGLCLYLVKPYLCLWCQWIWILICKCRYLKITMVLIKWWLDSQIWLRCIIQWWWQINISLSNQLSKNQHLMNKHSKCLKKKPKWMTQRKKRKG